MPERAPGSPGLLVVGAGPAGLAAAVAAREHGASVVLLEAAEDVGGQYWRRLPDERPARHPERLHHGWRRLQTLRTRLADDPGCRVLTGAQVWSVEARDGGPPRVHVLQGAADDVGRRTLTLDAGAVLFATGAHERVLPFPGWELPGVFTAGAAQTLAKAERVVVGERVLVAGAGPFLLPVATSLLHTGARVVEVAEASGADRLRRGWSGRPWQLLGAPGKAAELAGYAAALARHRVPYRPGTGVLAAHGTDRVEAVTLARLDRDWAPLPGTERTVAVDAVCLGHGFVPRAELALAAGCAGRADGGVVVDEHQRTSVPGVYAAGELTGIGGVELALAEGVVAGLAAVGAAVGRGPRRARDRQRVFADRLQAAHPVGPGWRRWLREDTVLCRCEDVTVGELTRVAERTGARGLRSLRLNSRVGLGPCQGRTCGQNAEELLAAQLPGGVLDAGRHAARPLSGTVRLGDLARADVDPAPDAPVPDPGPSTSEPDPPSREEAPR